ncbi:MAG: B12-binding domain-containing radical SAM protein [Candidatus Omnitrophica bacterium]|nr:B12-binding domain-containing radical SAM protein [Candidatus Omnitrophota bacterium]
MSKKIVLIQPKTGEWDFLGARPPDSLLAIAALPHKEGYDVKIIDQRIDKKWKETLKKELKGAILAGVTSMTGPQIKYALEVSRFIKENSDVPLVWGGVHASLLSEQTIQNQYIDIVVKGEGEYAFLEIIKAVESKSGLDKIKGIYYNENNEIKTTEERELINNLDELCDYPYELVNLDNYYGFNIKEGKSITLMTSRGCPYKCAFCYNTVYYKNTWRSMSAQRTIGLIKRAVNDFGVKSVFFQDDNFCANLNRFEQIVDAILKENIKFTWGLLGARADTLKRMSDNLLEKTARAGCVNIDVGIESGSGRILELISKDVRLSEVMEINKRLAKHFNKTKYTFIMGIPTETENELLQTTDFFMKLYKDNPNILPLFFIYCAYPGTKLYDIAIEHGFKEPKTLEEWAKIDYQAAYLRYPWLDKKRIKMLRNFEFTASFINKNSEYKINSTLFKILARMYRPIARLRFTKNIYQFPVDRILARALLGKLG